MMKTTSSSMASSANAVCSNGEPFSRRVQRARTADPARLKPIPTPIAATKLTASGQASSIAVTSSATLSTLIRTASSKTRAWPTRSVARPQNGATTAAATRSGGGEQSGQAEGACGQRHQQHDPDARHRHRQSRHKAGEAEGHGATVREHLLVRRD